jgi:uncharacterized membrane protein YtjA (UPF0391 family)
MHSAHHEPIYELDGTSPMLTSGLLFFFMAIAAVAFGFSGLAEAPAHQIAAFAIAALFLVLFVFSLVRRSNRPWR